MSHIETMKCFDMVDISTVNFNCFPLLISISTAKAVELTLLYYSAEERKGSSGFNHVLIIIAIKIICIVLDLTLHVCLSNLFFLVKLFVRGYVIKATTTVYTVHLHNRKHYNDTSCLHFN